MTEFEKARDAWSSNLNINAASFFSDGANWAREWFEKPPIGEQLLKQQRINQTQSQAIEKRRETWRGYAMAGSGNNRGAIKTLAEVKDLLGG